MQKDKKERTNKSSKTQNQSQQNKINKPCGLKYQLIRAVSVVLIFSMLTISVPAAPRPIAVTGGEVYQDLRFSYLANFGSSGITASLFNNPVFAFFFGDKDKKKNSKARRITKIEIYPGNAAIREGEKIQFSAVAYDVSGNVVQGTNFTWLAAKGAEDMPIQGGLFESGGPGIYYVGARAKGFIGTKRIVVREDAEFRAMKEIRRQEREAAESASGVSSRRTRQTTLRQEVLDEIKRIKANPAPSIKNSSKMSKADRIKLKKWDDAQKQRRRATRERRKQKRHLKTLNRQGKKSDVKNKKLESVKEAENKKTNSKGTGGKVKFLNTKWNSKNEASANSKTNFSSNEKLANKVSKDEINTKTNNKSLLAKKTKTTKSKKSVFFASGLLSGVNSSNQAYGSLFYPYPESGGGGGGGCPPWVRTCGGGSTTYYSEMEVYVNGNRTTGDFIGLYACAVQLCSTWTVDIPTEYQNGQTHTLNAYIVNDDGTQVTTASGSPKTFNSAQPPEWTNGNWGSFDDPGRHPGTPPNRGTAGPGSGNFGFSAPVLSLPGRNGLDVNLSLNYNSLLWHQDPNNNIIYDIDKGSPAPGWDIGFGKVLNMDTQGGAMLESINGTRHSYEGEIVEGTGGYSTYYGRTTDGSFIDYIVEKGPNGLIDAEAWMSNGTKITYGSESDGVLYPTQIKDAHGNYITITYVGNEGPNINTITDTLGRVVTFKYANGRLINIQGPGYNGTTRTYVRLHYEQKTLNATFSGLTKAVRDESPFQIKAIYYPITNMGYWFGDSDSYSSYGMIKKVMMNRSMTSNGTTTTEGTASKGTMSAQAVYNYPATASNLTSAPKYATKTDTWANMDTAAVVTNYTVNSTTNPRTITITEADGTKTKTYSYNTSDWKDGLLYKTELLSGTTVLNKSELTWAQGDYNSARITQVLDTDEKGQISKETFIYGTKYNQVTESRDYGYSTTSIYRKSVTTYENSVNYIGTYSGTKWMSGQHIFNLPTKVEVKTGTGTRLSQVDYTYDTGSLIDRSTGLTNYDQTYRPASGTYDSSTQYRGNVSQTTIYENAAGTPSGAIDYDYTYDITGNNITAATDCCQQIKATFASTTKYAYPSSIRRGAPTGTEHNTTSATYDFNTGLVKTSTDANGRVTTTTYDSIARPTQVLYSTGGKTTFEYFPDTLTSKQTDKLSDNTVVSQSTSILNGRGQSQITKLLTGTSSETATQVKYDIMGRQHQVSDPYPATSSPTKWTTYAYTDLSRLSQITFPDGSTNKNFYNEPIGNKPSSATSIEGSTVRTQDEWGRERWARSDEWGRLVEIVEPGPLSNGSVTASDNMVTTYTYDHLDQITQIDQGSQVRKFKYDSLGRSIARKIAEQDASINDSGVFVGKGGSGAIWSDYFTYDDRSNITQRIDSRGVKTNFNFNSDPLNRLQTITFDKTTADTTFMIHEAPDITYTYMTSGNKERIDTVTASGVSTEDYDYDVEGRPLNSKITLTSRSSYPMETSYLYDTASRMTEIRYPAQYGMSGNPRKTVNISYDQTSRLKELEVDSITQMDQITYNDSGQTTSIRIGADTPNPLTEEYSFDVNTRLLTNQKVKRGSTVLLDLSYNYERLLSKGSLNGKTGNLTNIVNNLNRNRDRKFEFDTLGRLIKAKGGIAAGGIGTANWTQNYTYDRYGNKQTTSKSGITEDTQAIPLDGLANQSFVPASNRIDTTNHEYDNAGNMTRGKAPDGSIQRFEYDEAGRLVKIKEDNGTLLEEYTYGQSRERLIKEANGYRIYYVWGGGSVLTEYFETTTTPNWDKSYIYAGSRLLSTFTKSGSTEVTEFQHPGRLGTKLITNTTLNTAKEQATLPFGALIPAETDAFSNQRFTSYDRSITTGLDYATNRTYNSGQSRFTQVDPISMAASTIDAPQSLNLYSYVRNNPIDFMDPTGLYEACVHEAMTRFLGREAGLNPSTIDELGYFVGGRGPDSADGKKFKATALKNIKACLKDRARKLKKKKIKRDSASDLYHFPTRKQLAKNKKDFPVFIASGENQLAAFMLHSVQDSVGAHKGFSNNHCQGHAFLKNPTAPDRKFGAGDGGKFRDAANGTYQLLTGNPNLELVNSHLNELLDFIKNFCKEQKGPKLTITKYRTDGPHAPGAHGPGRGPGRSGGRGGGGGGGGGGRNRAPDPRIVDIIDIFPDRTP